MFFEQKVWLSKLISVSIGRFLKDSGSRILMYHSIGAETGESRKDIYRMEESLFHSHMKYIKNLSTKEVLPLTDWAKNSDALIITFDDGFADVLTAAAILSSLNFPFTVFVSPSLVQSDDSRYLNTEGLVELSKVANCTIGSHGYSHVPLVELDNLKLKQELKDSKDWLENLLAIPIYAMSYPHGSVDRRVRDAVKAAGYKIAACSRPGGNSKDADSLNLHRTDIWSLDDEAIFKSKINGNWDWMKYII